MSSEVLTVRVDRKLKKRLDALARSTKRSRSFLAAEAIASYVETNDWQVAEIGAAVKEADAGEFASNAEIEAAFAKWSK